MVLDPMERLIEVHLAVLKWNMQQRRFGLTAEGVEKLHTMSVELLDLLKENMPNKTGEDSGWKFEKAHSILHKVREIILFGWTENFSTQVYYMIYIMLYWHAILHNMTVWLVLGA